MGEFKKALKMADLAEGKGRTVELEGKKIAFFNVGGALYATDDTCLHKGGPLGQGSLEGAVVTCPWHGWKYDVKTGASAFNPQVRVKVYNVKVEGEDLLVEL